jgi:hypothetical protein
MMGIRWNWAIERQFRLPTFRGRKGVDRRRGCVCLLPAPVVEMLVGPSEHNSRYCVYEQG